MSRTYDESKTICPFFAIQEATDFEPTLTNSQKRDQIAQNAYDAESRRIHRIENPDQYDSNGDRIKQW